MRIMRPVLAMLLLIGAGLSPGAAYAHASNINGLVNLTPEAPAPGQFVRLQVDMLDVYHADVPGARIRAAFAPDGKPAAWSATLREDPVGVYTGDVRTPQAGQAVILFEATLPDGKWYGELYVRVGPGGRPVSQEPIAFIHEDALNQQAAASQPAPVQAPAPAPARSRPATPAPAPQPAAPHPQPETATSQPAKASAESQPAEPQPVAPQPQSTVAQPQSTVAQPQSTVAQPQSAVTRPEQGTAQAQPAPAVSAAQLNQALAQVSRPFPAPWVLVVGAVALGGGLLLWYRSRTHKSVK
ncbi:MAG: hypothetical protein JWN15_3439 [Firmicutes bacterium]|nr:hypothetical protein [Bacillota bacterium]